MAATTKPRRESAPRPKAEPLPIDARARIDPNMVYQIVFDDGDKRTFSPRMFVGDEVIDYPPGTSQRPRTS